MEPMKIKQVGRLIQDQHGNPRGIEDWWIESRIDYPLDAAGRERLWCELAALHPEAVVTVPMDSTEGVVMEIATLVPSGLEVKG